MATTAQGAFTFVLHSHLPYARQAGRWPHGEEWIHEAASETYVPLLMALHDLADEGVLYKLTIGITPVLAEQLADPLILGHFDHFLVDKIERAEADQKRFRDQNDPRLPLAGFYRDFYGRVRDAFQNRFQRDLIGAFRVLQDAGRIEIATSAATHGYLPLLSRDSSIYGQLRIGVDAYKRHFGRQPRAIWLPECAYRPAYQPDEGGPVRPGLEDFLAGLGLEVFFAETHTIEGGRPVGKAAGDAIGPYGNVVRRYVIPVSAQAQPTERTTHQAYWVTTPQVAVIGRNNRTGLQVWSAEHGYPGTFDYREFHKKDGVSGLQYWRVTGARVDLADKDYYHPEWAEYRIREQAEHFCTLVENETAGYHARSGKFGIIAAAYDTELFGHWWFEGIEWIKQVLRLLSRSTIVELTTASEYVRTHPPEEVLALPESSWGAGGYHFTWLNVDTEWMWPIIHRAERDMEELVARVTETQGPRRLLLDQAARELVLLESSDWPFLVTTGQAREYAEQRFLGHVERFEACRDALVNGRDGAAAAELAEELFERDNLFPTVDPRVFAARQGRA